MPERRPRVWVMTFTRFVPVGPYVASIARRMSSATETLDRFASAERNSYWLGLSTSWNRCDKVLEVYTTLASVFATKLAQNWRERASRRPHVCGRRRSCTSTPLYSYSYAAVQLQLQLQLRRCTATPGVSNGQAGACTGDSAGAQEHSGDTSPLEPFRRRQPSACSACIILWICVVPS